MADDFVKEEVEDYKEEDMHFHVSVAHGSNYQHTRLVSSLNNYHVVPWNNGQFAQLKIPHHWQSS